METKKKSKEQADDWESYFDGVPQLSNQGEDSLQTIVSAEVDGAPSTAVRKALYGLVGKVKGTQGSVTFHVEYAAGFGKKDDSATLLKNTAYTKYRSASACAESSMYKVIKGHIKAGYLVVTQDVAPCRTCIGSYAGLAFKKKITILVYYQETHDLLNKAAGAVLFTPEGGAFWFHDN